MRPNGVFSPVLLFLPPTPYFHISLSPFAYFSFVRKKTKAEWSIVQGIHKSHEREQVGSKSRGK